MSTQFDSLIRLNRWTLDEQRRVVGELQVMEQRLLADREALDREIAQEGDAVAVDGALAITFGSYASAARARQETIDRSIAQLRQQIETAQEAVNDAYQELKKVELAKQAHEKRQIAKRKRKEGMMFDEIALEGFRRRTR